jgi:1,2-diacylglycerol 3-alpha-glucosyltransferase
MRIGFFTDFFRPQINGVSYSIDTFRAELEAMGHEVYIFAPSPSLRYREKDPHVIRFPAIKGIFFEDYLTSVFFPPQAIRKIEKLNLDIVHYHTPSQIGILGAYFAIHNGVPLVTTYHTDLFEYVKHYPAVLPGTIALSLLAPVITGGGLDEYRSSLSSIRPERNVDRWNQKIVERGITMLHNHCDAVVAPSLKMKKQLQGWKTQSEIEIVPTGVEEITTNPADFTWLKRYQGISMGQEIVLFVGRLGGEKNVELVVRSFELVHKRRPSAKLVIVGQGPDEDRLKQLAAKLLPGDSYKFTGFIDRNRLGALYQIASVFAFASLTDTQGLVINEAACAGVPVVMVDHDITEVVKDNVNGLFAKNNPRDFSAKILRVLKNDHQRHQLSQNGRKLGAEFSPRHQAEKLLRLYQEVITRHGQRQVQPKKRWYSFGDS